MDDTLLSNDRAQWYGELTMENLVAVAERIERMLTGKYFTFASSNEWFSHPNVEVRTSQKLCPDHTNSGNAVNVWYHENSEPQYGGFHVSQTDSNWGCSTGYTGNKPYIVFDYNQIKIEHAPSGHKIKWVIAIEDHNGR